MYNMILATKKEEVAKDEILNNGIIYYTIS